MKLNKIYFLPLGGSNEIGMNLNLYCYNNRWLLVDIGVSFAQNNDVSDISMASLDGWLMKYPNAINNLDGILITHAHEDHYGALVHLWHKLSINKRLEVHTTPFTKELLSYKIKDKFNDPDYIPVISHDMNADYQVGQFKIRSIYMTHSTVEQMAFVIEFPNGKSILHTGDWKLDDHPITGLRTNTERLSQLKNKVLAIVGDSTNALSDTHTGSEQSVADELFEYIDNLNDRVVIIGHFASNLARMQSCIDIAKKTNRTLLICGRSMHRFYHTGIKFKYIKPIDDTYLIGYIDDNGNLIQHNKISNKKRILVLCTGSQGEPNAFLSRLVFNRLKVDHGIELSHNTTLIFSSRQIPGNEIAISNLINHFIKLGVKIKKDIHVSGHPGRKDLKVLYQMINPKHIIPVHGAAMHINAHKEFAESINLNSVFTENGHLLEINDDRIILLDHVETSKYYLYGHDLITEDSNIFQEQDRLIGGILQININLRKPSVYIFSLGLFDNKSERMMHFTNQIRDYILKQIDESKRLMFSSNKPYNSVNPQSTQDNQQSKVFSIKTLRSLLIRDLKKKISTFFPSYKKNPHILINIT